MLLLCRSQSHHFLTLCSEDSKRQSRRRERTFSMRQVCYGSQGSPAQSHWYGLYEKNFFKKPFSILFAGKRYSVKEFKELEKARLQVRLPQFTFTLHSAVPRGRRPSSVRPARSSTRGKFRCRVQGHVPASSLPLQLGCFLTYILR